jgi:hypothetical protein
MVLHCTYWSTEIKIMKIVLANFYFIFFFAFGFYVFPKQQIQLLNKIVIDNTETNIKVFLFEISGWCTRVDIYKF